MFPLEECAVVGAPPASTQVCTAGPTDCATNAGLALGQAITASARNATAYAASVSAPGLWHNYTLLSWTGVAVPGDLLLGFFNCSSAADVFSVHFCVQGNSGLPACVTCSGSNTLYRNTSSVKVAAVVPGCEFSVPYRTSALLNEVHVWLFCVRQVCRALPAPIVPQCTPCSYWGTRWRWALPVLVGVRRHIHSIAVWTQRAARSVGWHDIL